MNTRRRMALQALLWSIYELISLGMISAFQRLTGSVVFVMLCVAAGLWACSEGLRALLLRLVGLPPLFAFELQCLVFGINWAGISIGLLEFPPGTPQGPVVLIATR
jgi:hypothetical protein